MRMMARMGSSDISEASSKVTANWETEGQMGATSPWVSQTSGSNRFKKYFCLKKTTDVFKTFRLESLMEEF